MSVTLEPVLKALGYTDEQQRVGAIKLLQATGAYGNLPGVNGIVDDGQAQLLLQHITFRDSADAAHWLHDATQRNMLRPYGAERTDCQDPDFFNLYRKELTEALTQAGMRDAVDPTQKYYDHLLVLGSVEDVVKERLDTVKALWDQGVRFGKIYLLGSDRPLDAAHEPIVNIPGADGAKLSTEMQMMKAHYYTKSSQWPQPLRDIPLKEINTPAGQDGSRANTQDTIVSWKNTNPLPGSVLAISSQPHLRYQQAAIKAVLPASYSVETVGSTGADERVSVALDAMARQIDAGFPQLLEALKNQKDIQKQPLLMIDPAIIKTDAATYQFRSNGDGNGVTAKGRYSGNRWDPILHGDPLLVHERTDGSLFVADGHHRFDLAKRLNAQGTGPGMISAIVLREADGYTPQDVKIIAAYKNIARLARGCPDAACMVDAAHVLQEARSGQVHQELLPQLDTHAGNLKDAAILSKLGEESLAMVARKEVPVKAAVAVAEVVDDKNQQQALMRMINAQLRQHYHLPPHQYDARIRYHVSVVKPTAYTPGKYSIPTAGMGYMDKAMAERQKASTEQLTR